MLIAYMKASRLVPVYNAGARRRLSTLSGPGLTRMQGKVCVVTGGAAGLGLGIVKQYAREGGKVVIADLDIDAAHKAAKELQSQGFLAIATQTDITDEGQVAEAVEVAVRSYGPLDVIVSNAGYQHIEALDEVSLQEWKKMLAVHVDGSFLCTKYGMREMKKNNRGGAIIYMGSAHSKVASPLKAPYVTSKHAILGLARAAAKEGSPFNIRTNVICPGFVYTQLVQKQIPEQAARLGISEQDVVKNVMLRDTVDAQFTTIDDVAEVAVFFASFPTNALTGQSIMVSHGWYMQ